MPRNASIILDWISGGMKRLSGLSVVATTGLLVTRELSISWILFGYALGATFYLVALLIALAAKDQHNAARVGPTIIVDTEKTRN